MAVFIKFTMHVSFVLVILISVLSYPTDTHGRNGMYKDVHCILTAVKKSKNKQQYISTEGWLNR